MFMFTYIYFYVFIHNYIFCALIYTYTQQGTNGFLIFLYIKKKSWTWYLFVV